MEGLDAEVIVETVDKAVIVVGEETIIANKGSIKRKAILGGEIVTGGKSRRTWSARRVPLHTLTSPSSNAAGSQANR